MPKTNHLDLTLTTTNQTTKINVTYNVVFSPFERFLADKGLQFEERITVLGVDLPDPGPIFTELHKFPVQILPVTAGAGPQTIKRDRSITKPRASLQEDSDKDPEPDDEIRCRVEIVPIGLPTKLNELTEQRQLKG